MDLEERIRRRQRGETEVGLVRDYEQLSPVAHLPEPVGRGLLLEEILDTLDPAFEGRLPDDVYVHGPKGVGKSAVVTALFEHLSEHSQRARSTIPTTTRARSPPTLEFVYVDARHAASAFAMYHAVLDTITEESVPRQGISTESLRDELRSELGYDRGAVVAVDHVGEPETVTAKDVAELFEPISNSVSWLAVGRQSPSECGYSPTSTVAVEPYERHALVDIVTTRTGSGLNRGTMAHEQVREVVEWADGDAHDALAAVFGAADAAESTGHDALTGEDIEDGMDDVPWQSVSLGRVLALPENRQRILMALLELPPADRNSVTAATRAIAASGAVDLSTATVKRVLYELAEVGIVRRVTGDKDGGQGRPPSRVEPRFPTRVFRRLFEFEHGNR
jgi:Cdc6-like AAA superfamily ATPase